MSFDHKSLALLSEILETLEGGFTDLPDYQPASDIAALRPVLTAAAERMHDNYPYQHPLYAGQMLKPPHPVARLAYAMAQFVNPNNHAMDGGRASSMMEREAVAELAAADAKLLCEHHLGDCPDITYQCAPAHFPPLQRRRPLLVTRGRRGAAVGTRTSS